MLKNSSTVVIRDHKTQSDVRPGELLEFNHLEVVVQDGNFDEAFRRFKMMVQKDKIIPRYKASQRYEKPSDKRRREKRESIQKQWLADLRERQVASGEWDRIQARKERKRLVKAEERKKKLQSENQEGNV